MKRYLVVFITEGEFACTTIQAVDLPKALEEFLMRPSPLGFDEIYSITLAA